ncbi:MAG: AarF/UbiB family protein [Pseudomonadota bacterium]
MSRFAKINQFLSDAASLYEGRERYIRVLKALRSLESAYRQYTKIKNHSTDPQEKEEAKQALRFDMAQTVADVCRENGALWVKFAQYLSCRPDLLPTEFVEIFQTLQRSAKVIPWSEMLPTIEATWGEHWERYFKHFDVVPVATASIAQVYKATLISGEEVAVKVQLPGLELLLQQDRIALVNLAKMFRSFFKELDLVQITDELIEMTNGELDFEREQSNIEYFHVLAPHIQIGIPKVFPELGSSKIIVAQWIEGQPLSKVLKEASYEKRHHYLKTLVTSIFRQIFLFGTYHADPHPGNFIVSENVLYALDFGLVGRLTDAQRKAYAALFMNLLRMGLQSNWAEIFQNAGFAAESPEIFNKIGDYIATAGRQDSIEEEMSQLLKDLRQAGIKIPNEFIVLSRVIIVLGGLLKQIQVSPRELLTECLFSMGAAEVKTTV